MTAPDGTCAFIDVAEIESTVPKVLLAPANVTEVCGLLEQKLVPVSVIVSPGETVDGVMFEIIRRLPAIEATYWVK